MTIHSLIRLDTAYGHTKTTSTSLGQRLRNLFALRKQRLDLAKLDDRLLDDVGLNRSIAAAEAKRPIWDAPSTWRG